MRIVDIIKATLLNEASPIKVLVVRNKRLKKKWKCPDGFSIEWPDKPGEGKPRCRKMTSAERRVLSRRAKKAAQRHKASRKLAVKKASRSRKKGKLVGAYSKNKTLLRRFK